MSTDGKVRTTGKAKWREKVQVNKGDFLCIRFAYVKTVSRQCLIQTRPNTNFYRYVAISS